MRIPAWIDQPALEPISCSCLVPALAVDASGIRLGYGGGYYDRLRAITSWRHVTALAVAPELHQHHPVASRSLGSTLRWLGVRDGGALVQEAAHVDAFLSHPSKRAWGPQDGLKSERGNDGVSWRSLMVGTASCALAVGLPWLVMPTRSKAPSTT